MIFGLTLKSTRLVAVPAVFVSAIFPVVAGSGTVKRTDVGVKCVIAPTSVVTFNVPDVTESKFVPFTVTNVPTGPDAGRPR